MSPYKIVIFKSSFVLIKGAAQIGLWGILATRLSCWWPV